MSCYSRVRSYKCRSRLERMVGLRLLGYRRAVALILRLMGGTGEIEWTDDAMGWACQKDLWWTLARGEGKRGHVEMSSQTTG